MIAVKEVLEKQWSEFCQYVKQFAEKDIDTNDEDYNMGRYMILNDARFSLLDPLVDYYITCNNIRRSDMDMTQIFK